jgi:ATP-dependent helicase/nuclease subunit A
VDSQVVKPFSIYRSSAGSGKTRTLAREYILLALKKPDYFRHILAMTFTNKSTQEMKDRILHYLSDFADGKSEDLSKEILSQLNKENNGWTAKKIQARSKETLDLLLHRYSDFSVSTIDAFFQRIIRGFARETKLMGNFKLEVDNEMVLEEAVNLLMDKLTDNVQLRQWMLDFSMERLSEGKNWDIRALLVDFSKEIFKEDFKKVEKEVLNVTSNKDFFKTLNANLWAEIKTFEGKVSASANELLSEFHKNGLTVSDFKYGNSRSIYAYTKLVTHTIELPGSRIGGLMKGASEWPSNSTAQKQLIVSQADKNWLPKLASIIELIEESHKKYISAQLVVSNLYSFGLLSDISSTVKEYLRENNLMLLSDSSKFLNTMMEDQDASFLYEKVGSFYRHFLIDEFQDTSGLQWSNLKPLVQNGIAQNYKSMIVGDIKQSIYRWRGGDLTILQDKVKQDIGDAMISSHTLETNFRSDGRVVQFNNAIFNTASQLIAEQTGTDFPKRAYGDANQKAFHSTDKGFVNIEFLDATEDENGKSSFDESSLQRLPKLLEDLQKKNVKLSDVAFLVRDNKDGQKIAQRFVEYRASSAKLDYRYDVVSNESLLLDQSTSVVILINAMRLLLDNGDQIARVHLAYEYQKLRPSQILRNDHFIFSESSKGNFDKLMPLSFVQQRETLAAMPLVEMVESLIYIFKVGNLSTEIPFLQSFQDVILEFSQREKSDLSSFLVWWIDNKHKKSVQVAGGVDAAQIITIHKSKGLQFNYVIIPFLDWDLDHKSKGPILWCKSDEPLFSKAGYLPIKYKKELAETYFSIYYEMERQRSYLDSLNLLYVAFTRAENGLIAFAPNSKQNKEGTSSNVGQLVKRTIEANPFLHSYWLPNSNQLQMGSIEAVEHSDVIQSVLTLTSYPVYLWRERLMVRSDGKDVGQRSGKREKIDYGIFFHSLMARILTEEDVEREIAHVIANGKVLEAQRDELSDTIKWMIHHAELKNCFQKSAKVKTEPVILLPNAECRVDRFGVAGKTAYVIDYKTGKKRAEDEEQVKAYMNSIFSMGHRDIRGYLVYVSDRKCEEIKLF